jgi:hypothetical protein
MCPAPGTPAEDAEQAPRLGVLLIDDRSAVGAGAAPPQFQHWRGRRPQAGGRLLPTRDERLKCEILGRLLARREGKREAPPLIPHARERARAAARRGLRAQDSPGDARPSGLTNKRVPLLSGPCRQRALPLVVG